MDRRAKVGIWATVAIVVGVVLVARFGQPFGGFAASLGIAGWVALYGTSHLAEWDHRDDRFLSLVTDYVERLDEASLPVDHETIDRHGPR